MTKHTFTKTNKRIHSRTHTECVHLMKSHPYKENSTENGNKVEFFFVSFCYTYAA